MTFSGQHVSPAASPASSAGFDDGEYAIFQQRVQAHTGIRLSDYKQEQMQRRLSVIAERSGYTSFSAYFGALSRDAALLSTFLNKITINVSELLRNPNRFEDLAREILPTLLARNPKAPLSVWSAGCSYGAEAYTLAMLLYEASRTLPHQIYGTDIDTEILSAAARGCFTEADMANISPARRAAHFRTLSKGSLSNSTYEAAPHLRAWVKFAKHDLLADPYPQEKYDLIVCRNVVIYFTDQAKERIYHGFYHALRPGGVLFVGGTERISDHRAIGFELALPFFYRKSFP